MVAWDVAEREDAQIAADLVSRACLRERIYKGRPQPLNSLLRQWQCLAAGFSKSCGPPPSKAGWRSLGC